MMLFLFKVFILKDGSIHINSEFAKNRLENGGAIATFSIPSPIYSISSVSLMLTLINAQAISGIWLIPQDPC